MRMQIALDITCGIAYMHAKNGVHGDIKSANVLLNEYNRECLTDFGLTRVTSKSLIVRLLPENLKLAGGQCPLDESGALHTAGGKHALL